MALAELTWNGKYDKDGRRKAPLRVALPFQTVETVNESAQQRQRMLDMFAAGRDPEWRNRLIWGDKKYVLPSLLPEFAGKVDLIYIDPPFATGADFSYQAKVGDDEFTKEANIIEQKAYRDTWGKGLDGYVSWFYETAVLLHELLADTGGIYVHCDPTASHYIKVILDAVFGQDHFRNEITWRRIRGAKNDASQYGRSSDSILFYTIGDTWTFDPPRLQGVDDSWYKKSDEKGNYVSRPLLAAGTTKGDSGQVWRGVAPKGHWIVPRLLTARYEKEQSRKLQGTVRERLDILADAGYIEFSHKGNPSWRRYLSEANPPRVDDIWDDDEVKPISRNSSERLDYPTQKPEALLERIIRASSNENDLVLDCFCGSGTTAAVAEKLNRRWIVGDLGRFAIHTARKRLLGIENVRPFVVQNLGKYERQVWQKAEFGENAALIVHAYRQFILDLYHAETIAGYSWLHGVKGRRMVHVGSVDSPIALGDVQQIAIECRRAVGTGRRAAGVDVLGWDFALDMNETARQIAQEAGLSVRFVRIPREVLEKKAVDQGDIRFFELAALSVEAYCKGREISIELTDFMVPPDDVPADVRDAVGHWSEWIDYWAVDFDYRGDAFHNQWQSYRTRKDRTLLLRANHTYPKPGDYIVLVKVIDILGNDTTKAITVKVM